MWLVARCHVMSCHVMQCDVMRCAVMNIAEVEEPETTKIYIQKPSTPGAPSPKVRKNTHKTNMQARKHENSDEIRPAPRSSHPAFYHYRKNPKC